MFADSRILTVLLGNPGQSFFKKGYPVQPQVVEKQNGQQLQGNAPRKDPVTQTEADCQQTYPRVQRLGSADGNVSAKESQIGPDFLQRRDDDSQDRIP